MKLIESKVELIEQQPGLEGVYKQIELTGRTCYKSEDKITGDSAKEFVDRMIKSKHGAMLEHGTVYLVIPDNNYTETHVMEYEHNPFTKSRLVDAKWYITTNFRVLIENDWLDDLKYIFEPTEHHEKRITARFTCDRGVSHEIVRHRVMSFAQESTRYCNYSKDKFGNELTFIKPSWMPYSNSVSAAEFAAFHDSLYYAESNYLALLELGWKPQQARQVLPNALKTEIVVTGFESDWKHFLKLRTAGAAHPDMRKLALELEEKLNNVNTDNKSN